MAAINELKKIDLSKIEVDQLRNKVEELLDDYEKTTDKELFENENQGAIATYFKMVSENFPNALASDGEGSGSEKAEKKEDHKSKTTKQKDKSKPDKSKETPKPKEEKESPPPSTDAKSEAEEKARQKQILEELKALDPELEACRVAIKEHNAKKREAEGPKPTPNRYTRLKRAILALKSLIPEEFKEDIEKLRKTEKALLRLLQDLVEIWEMTKVSSGKVAEAIKETFDGMEEKVETKQRKKTLRRWLAHFRDLKERAIQDSRTESKEEQKKTKTEMELLKESIDLYAESKDDSFKYLKKHFDKNEILSMVPDYIAEEMKLKKAA